MKGFVKSMVDRLNVEEKRTNVGVMTFSDTAHIELHLNSYNMRYELQDAIDKIVYRRGTTNTADALRLLRTEAFQTAHGDRPNLRNIAVVFTDGGSNNFNMTLEEAYKARAAGITILVVAISGWLNMVEINEIATDPDHFNVFTIANFDEINRIAGTMETYLCDRKYQ